jgi:hypothetical protein
MMRWKEERKENRMGRKGRKLSKEPALDYRVVKVENIDEERRYDGLLDNVLSRVSWYGLKDLDNVGNVRIRREKDLLRIRDLTEVSIQHEHRDRRQQ